LWPWCVAKIKRKLHERAADLEKENPQDRFARRTANATVVIAYWCDADGVILAIAAAIVGSLQYCTMQGQLNEMIAEQRAFIAVPGIWHDRQQPFVEGDAVTYALEFTNIGKTPASGLKWHIENGYLPTPNHRLAVPEMAFSEDDMCIAPFDAGQSLIFPDPNRSTYQVGIGYVPPALILQSDSLTSGPKIKVSRGMLDGTEAFLCSRVHRLFDAEDKRKNRILFLRAAL
jgi:hypothetical protein